MHIDIFIPLNRNATIKNKYVLVSPSPIYRIKEHMRSQRSHLTFTIFHGQILIGIYVGNSEDQRKAMRMSPWYYVQYIPPSISISWRSCIDWCCVLWSTYSSNMCTLVWRTQPSEDINGHFPTLNFYFLSHVICLLQSDSCPSLITVKCLISPNKNKRLACRWRFALKCIIASGRLLFL